MFFLRNYSFYEYINSLKRALAFLAEVLPHKQFLSNYRLFQTRAVPVIYLFTFHSTWKTQVLNRACFFILMFFLRNYSFYKYIHSLKRALAFLAEILPHQQFLPNYPLFLTNTVPVIYFSFQKNLIFKESPTIPREDCPYMCQQFFSE